MVRLAARPSAAVFRTSAGTPFALIALVIVLAIVVPRSSCGSSAKARSSKASCGLARAAS